MGRGHDHIASIGYFIEKEYFMYLLYRYCDGSYVVSSPDAEWSRQLTCAEGQELLSRWPREVDCKTREMLLAAQGPGFIVS
jgi:hypothetical protein